MRSSSKRVFVPTVVLALSTLTTFAAPPASADDGHGKGGHATVLSADLMGSNPAPASPSIDKIHPGVLPWVVGDSRVRVRSDGQIRVRVRGLVIPVAPLNGTNPVSLAVATLVCGNTVADSTMPFALDGAGNGRVRDTIMVPRHCADATVLIQPAANRSVYIASTTDDDDE